MPSYVLTIAGVTKTMRPGFSIRETANGRNTMSFDILSADASYRPSIGDDVGLTEGGVKIYGGLVDAPAEAGLQNLGTAGIVTRVTAVDYNVLASWRVMNTTIVAGNLKAALTVIVTYLSAFGVSLDAAQVNGPSLSAIPLSFTRVDDALNQLSTITGYTWEIDYNKKLKMTLPASTPAAFNVGDGDGNAIGDIAVQLARTNYANRVLVLGGTGLQQVTDTFTGDGATTAFTLRYSFAAGVGYVTVGGVNETLGSGSTWSQSGSTIARTSAPGVGVAISITYTAQFPVLQFADNGARQAIDGYVIEQLRLEPQVFDVTVLQALATGYVAQVSVTPLRTVRYTTNQTVIHPGMTQTITIVKRGVNATFLVTDVEIKDEGGIVRRTVTAVEGTQLVLSAWKSAVLAWSGKSAASGGGGVVLIGGGGSGSPGSGTAGKLPKWATVSTLGDSLVSESGSTVTVTGLLAVTSGLTSATQDLITRTGTLVSGATGAGFTIALTTSTVTGNLAYARLPTGSGTWTAVPTISGILTLSSDVTVGGNAGTTSYASQTTGWRVTAAGAADFRNLYTDELTAKSFIADLEQALAGGQIICKSVAVVGAAFTVPAAAGTATLTVEDLPSAPNMAVFVSGDTVVLRSFTRENGGLIIGDAIGVVTAYADAANGLQTWTFTRNSGANAGSLATSTVIAAKSLALDYGTTGSGYYEVSALDGTVNVTSITRALTTATVTTSYAHGLKTGDTVDISGAVQTAYNGLFTITVTGTTTFTYTVAGSPATPATGTILINGTNGTNAPYAQVVTWATSPIGANKTVRTRTGNLRGITGTNGEYGLFAGAYAATNGHYLRASNAAFELHGIRFSMWDGSNETIRLDETVPSIALGSTLPTAYGTGTGIWMGKDTTYKFRVGDPTGNRLAWDGTNLTLVSEKLTIDNNGVQIAQPPATAAQTYGFKFLTSFSGTNWCGLHAYEPSAALRNVWLIHSASAVGKTIQTGISCDTAIACQISLNNDGTTTSVDVNAQNLTSTGRITVNTSTDGPLILNFTGAASPNTQIGFYRSGVVQGSITTTGGTTAYNTTSDRRLKEDVRPTGYGLSDLLRIEVSDFTMLADSGKTKRTGFMAQQLHGIFPAPVTAPANPSDPWQMDYSKLTPLLVVSVQQLAGRVDALERKAA